MSETRDLTVDYLETLPKVDVQTVNNALIEALQSLNKQIIVLDDDPTGVQTVHDTTVFTEWTVESIEQGFLEGNSMFFILTNSRGFTAEETQKVHQEIASNILTVAAKLNREFIIISRSDSTLRGHYPLETKLLKETLEAKSEIAIDGEVILPFFKEGGRLTINNVHYVQSGDDLLPAGDTEFAKDRTFGYTASHLGEWIEEKSNGEFKANETLYISLNQLRSLDIETITEQLCTVKHFGKVVVNAVEEVDVNIFTIALVGALNKGKNFIFRTAAALPKVIGGVSNRTLLTKEEVIPHMTTNGGLVIIGSHVKKTTDQLNKLKELNTIEFVAFDTHLVLEPKKFKSECDRVVETAESLIQSGKTVVVYTRRDRLDLGEDKKEEELKLSVTISEAVTSIVKRLEVRPKFLIAKGGITSSDIGTKGLRVKKATVIGQIRPGIPVWRIGYESKYPGMSYIIFPGNVGSESELKEIVSMLESN